MEFTKEEIETAKKLYSKYRNQTAVDDGFTNFADWVDSLLKPKTKKIIVEIEVYGGSQVMFLNGIENALRDKYYNAAIKVTELPEVFSKKDLIEFTNYHHHVDETVETNINDWLSQRKSK